MKKWSSPDNGLFCQGKYESKYSRMDQVKFAEDIL